MTGERTDAGAGDGPPLVMIVDPNRDFRTILETMFEDDGFESASTADPDEALRWARTCRPLVLIGEHVRSLVND